MSRYESFAVATILSSIEATIPDHAHPVASGIEGLDGALGLRSSWLYLVDGPATLVDGFVYGAMVRSLHPTPQRTLFVDCSNAFSVHAIAGLCRKSNIDPIPVLDSILVSRPFTCYQLNTLMREIHRVVEEARPPILAFSGLLDLFHSEDVEAGDTEIIFPRLLRDIRSLVELGPSVLVTNRRRWRRRGHLSALVEAADTILRLRPLAGNRTSIRIEKDPVLREGEVEHAWGLDRQLPLDQFLS